VDITYFINQYPKVSHTFIRREILELENNGFKVQRVSLRGWDTELKDSVDIKEQAKTNYVLSSGLATLFPGFLKFFFSSPTKFAKALKLALKMSKMSERGMFYHIVYLMEACTLANYAKAVNSSHIHAHFGTNSTEVTMLASILSGIDYSFTVHGPEEFDKPLGLHLKEKISHSKFVVAITSYCRSQLFRWADFKDWNKVKIVHCGLDSNFLKGQPAPPVSNHIKKLLCIGRLCEQKGQLLLLKALKKVLDEGENVELVLAGDGEMRTDIDVYIAENSLQDNVKITGWISSNEVHDLLLQSDAMILPSFAEGLPVAIMEALAVGRPVLATYIAGIPELITHNKQGVLFHAGDVIAIKKAIKSFINMPEEEIKNMVSSGYASVNERHNIVTEAKKLALLIKGDK